MPVSKYGLLEEDPSAPGSQGTGNISNVSPNQGSNAANLNPFGTPRAVAPLGAEIAIPQVQQFAFNPKYAAQSTAIEHALANQDLTRQNQLGAIDADWTRAKADAQRGRDQALKSLINKYASSGLLDSGIDAMSRGEMEGNFQRFLGDLDLNRANARQGVNQGWAQAINAANQQRSGMFGQQQAEEEAARLQAERDRAEADRQQREAAAAQRRHEEQLAAQRAAAAAPPITSYQPPTAPGAGGGGGLGIQGMQAAGINPGDTMQDLQGQINLLYQTGGTHQLALMYNHPYFQTPNMQPMRDVLRTMISNMSTVGHPYYSPARPSDAWTGGMPGGTGGVLL